ncbi:MAG: hypothetical protein LBE20_00475 [Deltaproteobacteria bacterium]|jgi:hypothetical protein|nr:hypothetical protein [Deltaproteobacteria bacterium]
MKAIKQNKKTNYLDSSFNFSTFSADPKQKFMNTEIKNVWHSTSENIFSLSIYPNGISLAHHKQNQILDDGAASHGLGFLANSFHLRLKETKDYQIPNGKFFVYKENALQELEHFLAYYHKRNILQKSVFYFGLTSDPFWSFELKHQLTMGCINLLEKYQPGFVVVQTRSALVLAALPFLKYLDNKAVVAINIETIQEKSVALYTPGQPKITARLLAADSLRTQGIKVNLVVSPILPYGDYLRDAWSFAEVLDNHSDYISFGSLANGIQSEEIQLRDLELAGKLTFHNQVKFLRPLAYANVYNALKEIAPAKLELPELDLTKANENQLNLFAAA